MTLVASTIRIAERLPLPDPITLAGIECLVGRTRRRLALSSERAEQAFAREMTNFPIAEHAADANAQHYEIPAAFFSLVLGPRRKYSCCFYENPADDLAHAEIAALKRTATNAGLADGQRILELGCGWGSLSLWMAENFPNAEITAVSNSSSQRDHILARAAHKGLRNLTVVTADMNVFTTSQRYDRVVSVEMFEHMANWRGLLQRIRGWLAPGGELFIHVFTSRTAPYRFDHRDPADWIAQNFFTGGIMPSRSLIREFNDLFEVTESWQWPGTHYARTAADWLGNFDANRDEIEAILTPIYGTDIALWLRRWRLFFLSTMGLFGHADGEEWGVTHYRLRPADAS